MYFVNIGLAQHSSHSSGAEIELGAFYPRVSLNRKFEEIFEYIGFSQALYCLAQNLAILDLQPEQFRPYKSYTELSSEV